MRVAIATDHSGFGLKQELVARDVAFPDGTSELRKEWRDLAEEPGVSMELYINSDLEQKRAAVNRLEAAVLRRRKQERRSA